MVFPIRVNRKASCNRLCVIRTWNGTNSPYVVSPANAIWQLQSLAVKKPHPWPCEVYLLTRHFIQVK